jgi:hypothetical protein
LRAKWRHFLAKARMSPSRFGRAALGDPSFVAALNKGRAPNLRTIEKARAFIQAYPSMNMFRNDAEAQHFRRASPSFFVGRSAA